MTLWIAPAATLPVALHATTSFGGGSSTTLNEQITWSDWDDPRLRVPVVK